MNKKYGYFFWILLVFLTIAKLFYIGWGPLDLSPDEAHYWDWSRHPDFSYYSKGPFIAYTIFLGAKLGNIIGFSPPNPAFWVRFPAVLYSLFMGLIAWFLTKRLWQDLRVAWYTILILTAIPIYAVGSILMTIDNPLMLFWAMFVWFMLLALETEKARFWCLAGVALGLGFLSKYTMIVLVPSLILYLLFTKEHRFWFKKKEFYLCIGIALLFFLPILLWNYKNDWIGFRHLQYQAGLGGKSLEKSFISNKSLWNLLEFIGVQFGVISPGLFFLIIAGFVKALYLYKKEKNYKFSFLFWIGIPLGVFYLILSLHKPCQPNWPVPVYFTGAILAGLVFIKEGWVRFLKISIFVGLLLWLLIFNINLFQKAGISVPVKADPTVRLTGWRELGQEVGRIRDRLKNEGNLFIFSDRYQITSELAFYTPGQPETYCINLGRRMNQYDLWHDFEKLIGYNALYVKHRDQEMNPKVSNLFESWKKLPLINIRKNGRLVHQYSVFVCYKFKGGLDRINNEKTY